jgi:hypothetical protein
MFPFPVLVLSLSPSFSLPFILFRFLSPTPLNVPHLDPFFLPLCSTLFLPPFPFPLSLSLSSTLISPCLFNAIPFLPLPSLSLSLFCTISSFSPSLSLSCSLFVSSTKVTKLKQSVLWNYGLDFRRVSLSLFVLSLSNSISLSLSLSVHFILPQNVSSHLAKTDLNKGHCVFHRLPRFA